MWSPSSRRAWIEIFQPPGRPVHLPVALLAEGVDRNKKYQVPASSVEDVALLAEGVDRNSLSSSLIASVL